ncbi:MAG: dTDP-4-dehydrorhamnose reductase [Halioglobus sp.]|nr:dTDP-4-dehydrorhamnose reductase [Halioglobus sp.]
MKALVTGANGQLGGELGRTATDAVACTGLGRAQLDIADAQAVRAALEELQPDVVINAAAYTAVDAAEADRDAAWRTNAEGAGVLAACCAGSGARLLHLSTDFVFAGDASTPYAPAAAAGPLGEYGRSKLAGEQAVLHALPRAFILRTGWVYAAGGNNFVNTMLRLMAERDELSVVADQVGTPTWARGLAAACWAAAARPQLHGIYHWSDAGVCSWYDFAVAILEEGGALGLVRDDVAVRPVSSAEYPTAARRPAYSVLDKSSAWRDLQLPAVHWRRQLRAMLNEVKETRQADESRK